jgi:hypothetical protein
MEIFHQSYRLLLYTPFWIVNHTNLKLEFQVGDLFLIEKIMVFIFYLKIENERMIIENSDQTYFICPEKYKNDSKEKV